MKNQFTEPKIAQYSEESGTDWFIWFRFNGKPIFLKKGINTLPYNERYEYCAILRQAIADKLEAGWEPDNSKAFLRNEIIIPAITQAMESIKRNVSKNTYDAYKGTANSFISAIRELKLHRLVTQKFTRAHAKGCLEHIRIKKNWTNANYNKNLGYIRSVFSEIVEADQMQTNPFREIKNLKVEQTEANIPPTDEEMRLICDELQAKEYGFYVFYMCIYYCGIRPDELRNLKVKHLDLLNKNFVLPPEITKTKKARVVPMLGNIHRLLNSCEESDPEFFVFGTWVPNGGRHSRRNRFTPNPHRLKEDTPNKLWNSLIKDGLGIDKSLYSAKHKGADDKLSAGMDKQTICDIFGHSDTKMTERYMKSLKFQRFDEARNVQMKSF